MGGFLSRNQVDSLLWIVKGGGKTHQPIENSSNSRVDRLLAMGEEGEFILEEKLLEEIPSQSFTLGQEVFIAGKTYQPKNGEPISPFIYRTYINRVEASGRIGLVEIKEWKISGVFATFDEAYDVYKNKIIEEEIQFVQEYISRLLAFRDETFPIEEVRTRVITSIEGTRNSKEDEWAKAMAEMQETETPNESAVQDSGESQTNHIL